MYRILHEIIYTMHLYLYHYNESGSVDILNDYWYSLFQMKSDPTKVGSECFFKKTLIAISSQNCLYQISFGINSCENIYTIVFVRVTGMYFVVYFLLYVDNLKYNLFKFAPKLL